MISAVMTVCNDAKHVKKFLESFVSQTYDVKDIEFVITDAGSSDGTVEIITRYQKKLPKLNLIVKKSNRSEGRNLAIKKTSGELILTFNSDVRLEKDCIENLISEIKSHPDVGGIAAMQIYPTNQNFLAKCIYHLPGMAQVSLVTTPQLARKATVETHSIPCECGIWRKEALPPELFDERLNWGEDSELHFRMRKAGWRLYGTRKARFEHFYKNTLRGFWGQQIGYGAGASTLMKLHKGINWGFRWKKYLALSAPVGFLAWLAITLLYPWIGAILVLAAILPLLKVAVRASMRSGLRFLAGMLFIQIIKYTANVVGFWKGMLKRSPS